MKSVPTLPMVARTVALALVAMSNAAAQDSFNSNPPSREQRGPAAQVAPVVPVTPAAPATNPSPAAAAERQDFGIAASDRLHTGALHGPTPNSIPGAQLVTTQGLVELLKIAAGRVLVFDVLGGNERLPGALNAVPAHQPGSFDDAVQREFGQYLQQVTQGQKDRPLVFYCQSTQCWMSYNAALRASRLGYSQVLWYRGGIEAWKAAGQRVQGPGAAGR